MPGYLEIKTGDSYPTYDLQMAAGIHLIHNGTPDGLEFEDEDHVYRANGDIIPSITQVPKLAGMSSFRPGMEWYMDKGKALHKATELYDKGVLDEDTIDPAIEGEFSAYKRFRAEAGITIRSIETRLWCPKYRFAGTLDRIIEGPTSYNLYLRKNGTYRLKEYPTNQMDWQFFLSALICVTGHQGAGLEIAKMNVKTWIKRNMKGEQWKPQLV
jgi:hypothetical protein